MKKYTYCVQYIIKRMNKKVSHGLYIDADNAAEARKVFDSFYQYAVREMGKRPHPFNVSVKRVKDDDILDAHYIQLDARWVL